jgi:hypothetical protein
VPEAPCWIQQNWPPCQQMLVGGDNPQHGGIVQDTVEEFYQPIAVWSPGCGVTGNWYQDSLYFGGGLPTMVEGCEMWAGTTAWPATIWRESGHLLPHAFQ